MNFKELMKKAIAAQNSIFEAAKTENRAMTTEEQTKFDELEVEIKNLEKSIDAEERLAARNKILETPVNTPIVTEVKDNGVRLFKNFGEQLKAIRDVATTGRVDERLNRLNNEFKNASGMSEGVGADGGFAVQTDFAGMMMDTAVKSGNILPLVDQYDVGPGSNGVKWVDIDESDVSSTVFGGVQVYWASEAAAIAASKPKLQEKELKLEKLMGLAYATYELEGDSNFTSQLYDKAFTIGIQRALEAAIISGDGIGKPIGISGSASRVAVAKETGQVAGTVVWENISKMYNRGLNKDQIANYVWLGHPDLVEQFDFLNFPIGTGGVPVYLPAAQVGSVSTLKGKSIIETDHCATPGTEGDLIFANMMDYMLITKGGVQADTSMHIQFLTAENAFRFIFRANGMPKRNKAVTIKNSANKRSSIVTLAARG